MYVVTLFESGGVKDWVPVAVTTKNGALRKALEIGAGHPGKTIILGWQHENGKVDELAYRESMPGNVASWCTRWRHVSR